MKINIALIEPEIPQNTGNIVRTAVATGAAVHLVKPLGFDTADKSLKRAGLDYWHDAEIYYYESADEFFSRLTRPFHLLSTKAEKIYSDASFKDGDFIIFGRETKGLPESLISRYYDRALRIPMLGDTRSLNLSNAVAIIVYESLRQNGFPDLKTAGFIPKR